MLQVKRRPYSIVLLDEVEKAHSQTVMHTAVLAVCILRPSKIMQLIGVVRFQWPISWLCAKLRFKPNMESAARETGRKSIDK
jgi:hypothetical protein